MGKSDSILLNSVGGDLGPATAAELAQSVFAAKARRRTWLASLPVEEKYRRFLSLQRMTASIRAAAGKPAPRPWPDFSGPKGSSCEGLATALHAGTDEPRR